MMSGIVTADDLQLVRKNTKDEISKEHERQEKMKLEAVKRKDYIKSKKRVALSFTNDDDDDDDDDEGGDDEIIISHKKRGKKVKTTKSQNEDTTVDANINADTHNSTTNIKPIATIETKQPRLTKDPTINTDFLPDKYRDQKIQDLREKLEDDWISMQEKVKNEKIEVVYSYWDGTGHRRSVSITKGTSIGAFLEICRSNLLDNFHELRAISADNLVYIKEDLIIPHYYTFYDLIVTKARGKSGPLFHFGVHEDIRLQNDARVETDSSHAGKIVTRSWYERNKHIFPATRWEIYDPNVKRDKYTIHGDEVR